MNDTDRSFARLDAWLRLAEQAAREIAQAAVEISAENDSLRLQVSTLVAQIKALDAKRESAP